MKKKHLKKKIKILTKALETIRDDSNDWYSKAVAIATLNEIIRIK